MNESKVQQSASVVASEATTPSSSEKADRREIKGGIPYLSATGTFKRALDGIIVAERPDKFSQNFMETILNIRGGAARAVPPLLKKMQFLAPDGSPTVLYSKFKTDTGRSQAAFDGLKNAFQELFKRNEYVYRADEVAIRDILVEITGLKKNDPVIRQMYSTFDTLRSFVLGDPVKEPENNSDSVAENTSIQQDPIQSDAKLNLGLSYQINVILPETENIAVFNAIFKSLRDNLLR